MQAAARVQITVEFQVGGGAWPNDSKIEDVHRQAHESALDILRRGLVIDGLTVTAGATKTHATVVGEPRVTAILVERQS